MKKVYLETLFNKKDCYGWAWHTKGRHYYWQNDNDLGLLGQDWEMLREYKIKETILRKEKVTNGKYLYILRNNCKLTDDKSCTTITTIKALLKECHAQRLNQKEQKLVNRFWEDISNDLEKNAPKD